MCSEIHRQLNKWKNITFVFYRSHLSFHVQEFRIASAI